MRAFLIACLTFIVPLLAGCQQPVPQRVAAYAAPTPQQADYRAFYARLGAPAPALLTPGHGHPYPCNKNMGYGLDTTNPTGWCARRAGGVKLCVTGDCAPSAPTQVAQAPRPAPPPARSRPCETCGEVDWWTPTKK